MKTVIITGCTSGIGMGTAKKFLSEGYRVVGMSRRDFSAVAADNGC